MIVENYCRTTLFEIHFADHMVYIYIIHQFNWMRCDIHQAMYTTGAVVTFRVIK